MDPWELAHNVNRRSEGKPWGQGCSGRCVSSSFSVRETVSESCPEGLGEMPLGIPSDPDLPLGAWLWACPGTHMVVLVQAWWPLLQGSLCPGAKGAVCIWGHREVGWPDLWLPVLCSCGTGAWPGPWAGCGLVVG